MVKILQIAKSGRKISIMLDNNDLVWLAKQDFDTCFLSEGDEIDDDSFYKMIRLFQYPRALNQAVALLARRPCSKKEIERKLIMNRYMKDTIDLVLYKLNKEKLIDDQIFSEQWFSYRSSQKYGPSRIRMELKQKGISDDIIHNVMSGFSDSGFNENAVNLAKRAWLRIKPGEDRNRNRQKIIACLVRKGYGWEQAKKACEFAENQIKMHDD